jgi:hypothetical protein
MPGEDPAGTCNAPVTCATAAPICPDGNVPLVLDGCYTGQCRAIAQCESAPSCADLTHEADCLARSGDCSAVYTGHGCHTPTGVACQSGDSNCVCTSFTFASCEDKGPATREVVDSAGRRVDLNVSYLQQ